MMDCGETGEMGKMKEKMMKGFPPEMMMEMMPECLEMMFAKLSPEQRSQLTKKLFDVLSKQGGAEMAKGTQKGLVVDDRIEELIAIGASVTANCQPCLEYHAGEAKKLEAETEDIQKAIEIGQMVKKGAMRKYNEFLSDFFK